MDNSVISVEIVDLLTQVQHPNTRENAEAKLQHLRDTCPQYPIYLIKMLEESKAPFPALFMASILIKNYVRDLWLEFLDDGRELFIPQDIREVIKTRLVELLGVLPTNLNVQIYTTVQVIAKYDYPERWPSLINVLDADDDMCTRLSLSNIQVSVSVLRVLRGVFERYRYECKTQDLFQEIRTVIDTFAPKYLEFFKALDSNIDTIVNKDEFFGYLECINEIVDIFRDLSSQDIPDFFQDNIQIFFGLFKKYLHYTNPLIQEDNDDNPGVIENIRTGLCKCFDFYSKMYPDEGIDFFDLCSEICSVIFGLTNLPKYDTLVISAIEFLRNTIQMRKYVEKFRNVEILVSICESLIIKNIRLRSSDIEFFEDDPIEYVREVFLQGANSGTRRKAVSHLVSSMLVNYCTETTRILSGWIGQYFEEYSKDPSANWAFKDNAIYLFTILSIKTKSSFTGGAITINNEVPVISILTTHILPELTLVPESGGHPLVKVDSLMCICMFINQFDRLQLKDIMTLLIPLVNSSNCGVYTSALVCLERIMSTTSPEQVALYRESSYNKYFKTALDRCFQIINSTSDPLKVAENEYVMMAIFKIIVFSKDISPVISSIIDNTLNLLSIISTNPSNPKFNHYLFETIGFSLRSIASTNPDSIKPFENLIFASFDQVINLQVVELIPYIIQIVALMLSLSNSGVNGTRSTDSGIPPSYYAIIKNIVTPNIWNSKANVPALTKLVCKFLEKDPVYMAKEGNYLQQILGIFQRLMDVKSMDYFAFEILEGVFINVDIEYLTVYIKPIFIVLLTKLMQNKTDSFQRSFAMFFYSLILMEKKGLAVDDLIRIFTEIQNDRLFCEIIQAIIIPNTKLAMTQRARFMCVQALSKLIVDSNTMRKEPFVYIWNDIIEVISNVCSIPIAEDGDTAPEKTENLLKLGHEELTVEYEAEFSPLKTATTTRRVYGKPMKISELKSYIIGILKDFDTRSGNLIQNNARQAFINLLR